MVNQRTRRKWVNYFRKEKVTGEPYIMFKGNVNKNNPEMYKKNGLKVFMTNICSEITLHTDENHSFVCCLSSVTSTKYDEWKDTDLIYTVNLVLGWSSFRVYSKAKNMRGFENSVATTEKR